MDVSVLFLEGLTYQSRQVVEIMCNGEFKDKRSEGVLDYLDYIVENAQHWDTVSSYESSNKSQSSLSGRGMYNNYVTEKLKNWNGDGLVLDGNLYI